MGKKLTEEEQFINAARKSREHFSRSVGQQDWNVAMRTSADSVLIMYDQLVYRLETAYEKIELLFSLLALKRKYQDKSKTDHHMLEKIVYTYTSGFVFHKTCV